MSWMDLTMLYCKMTVKRLVMAAVSVMKKEAQTVMTHTTQTTKVKRMTMVNGI